MTFDSWVNDIFMFTNDIFGCFSSPVHQIHTTNKILNISQFCCIPASHWNNLLLHWLTWNNIIVCIKQEEQWYRFFVRFVNYIINTNYSWKKNDLKNYSINGLIQRNSWKSWHFLSVLINLIQCLEMMTWWEWWWW